MNSSATRINNKASAHRAAQTVEDLEWIIGTDHPDNILARIGYRSYDSLFRTLRRNGRDDLIDRLLHEKAIAR